jgi:hypothetical protein
MAIAMEIKQMPKTHPKFRNGRFNGFETSDEILAAIEDVAGYEWDIDAPYDEEEDQSPCYRIWAEPTSEQEAAVIATAWTYADSDTDHLNWGQTTICR